MIFALAIVLRAGAENTWVNSTAGIHTFGLWSFDEKRSNTNLSEFDFVWSLEFADVPAFRAQMARGVLSKYLPFSLAPVEGQNLTWWQEIHPCVACACC